MTFILLALFLVFFTKLKLLEYRSNESKDDLNSYYSALKPNDNKSNEESTFKSVDNDSKTDNRGEKFPNAKNPRIKHRGGFSMPSYAGHTFNIFENARKIQKKPSDEIINIMMGNLKEIREYYRLSKRQAGWAFWSAIVSFFAGFVFLGVVIWILLNKSTDTLALIIPAIGTVVSELFGLTIFSVYKKSLNQLNSYYDSLHDNERFISLLYITDKLSDPKQRDELFTQIVKDQISTINRQKTKAEEQNAKKPSGKKVVLVKKNKKNNSKNP